MSYLIVEANCRFSELQCILRQHGIELEQRSTHWRAILHERVYDPVDYVGRIIIPFVDCYVELERVF
jgi:hypothetical protein